MIPFIGSLLHTVLAWKHHRTIDTEYGQMKTANDVVTIREMLELGGTEDVQRDWLPEWFLQSSSKAVEEFVAQDPASEAGWRKFAIK